MEFQLVFVRNPIQDRDPRLARQFEQTVAEVLRSHDHGDFGLVEVRFHVWYGEDAVKYVCKVECPSARSMEMDEPPWRWWSGLVETAQELDRELREAVGARFARATRKEPAAERQPERWGWAGELTLR